MLVEKTIRGFGGPKSPSGVQGQSHGWGLGRSRQKLKHSQVIPTGQNSIFVQLFQSLMNTERFQNFLNGSGLHTIQLKDKLKNKITLFAGECS